MNMTVRSILRRKLEIHYDFVIVTVICFALSAGFNIYLLHKYNQLFTEHIDLQWQAQNHQSSHLYAKQMLEACEDKLGR